MFKELNEKGVHNCVLYSTCSVWCIGVPLSMETQNSLLGLLAYLGKGSAMADQEPTGEMYTSYLYGGNAVLSIS